MADNDSSNRTHILSITDKRYTSSSLCSRSILCLREDLSIRDVHCLSRIQLTVSCPGSLPSPDMFNHHCLFSYPDDCLFFCPGLLWLFFSSMFMRLLGFSLPIFQRRMSLLEVRMSYRFVSPCRFQCYH